MAYTIYPAFVISRSGYGTLFDIYAILLAPCIPACWFYTKKQTQKF